MANVDAAPSCSFDARTTTSPQGKNHFCARYLQFSVVSAGTLSAGSEGEGGHRCIDQGLNGECQRRLVAGATTFSSLLFRHTSFNCPNRPTAGPGGRRARARTHFTRSRGGAAPPRARNEDVVESLADFEFFSERQRAVASAD